MLTHEIRETQTAIELPAREMMLSLNWARVVTVQHNVNLQAGFLNINGGQVNSSTVVIGQGAED
jgi:hypothetical protein